MHALHADDDDEKISDNVSENNHQNSRYKNNNLKLIKRHQHLLHIPVLLVLYIDKMQSSHDIQCEKKRQVYDTKPVK